MNVLTRTSWDLALRVTLCYLVFYVVAYIAMLLLNGFWLDDLIAGHGPHHYGLAEGERGVAVKFIFELAARMLAAVALVYFNVPRYRFALMQEGNIYTRFRTILPRWIGPMFVLALITSLGQQLPISQMLAPWLLFHIAFAFGVVHYMMHGVPDAKKLRLLEDI